MSQSQSPNVLPSKSESHSNDDTQFCDLKSDSQCIVQYTRKLEYINKLIHAMHVDTVHLPLVCTKIVLKVELHRT